MSRARNACPWCCRKTDVIQGGDTIQVRYFLSRMGRIEHSHIIRFQHANPKSIHLRDVKKWLSDAEGKEMPQSYAWSYKRRYKAGYVWHDVLDDDAITPISNNEYVLQGSAISSFTFADCTCKDAANTPDTAQDEARKQDAAVEERGDILVGRSIAALEVDVEEDRSGEGLRRKRSLRSPSSKGSRGSSSGSGSHVFRNLLTCGEVEAKESAVVPITRRKAQGEEGRDESSMETSKGSLGGGAPDQQQSSSSFSSDKNSKSWKKGSEFANQNKVTSLHKPLSEPMCSQCGKTFKPEKLHAHMQSCKGLKALAKGGERPVQTTTEGMRTQGENLRPHLLAITTA